MFTVKNRLPYKSDVNGDTKGWLHKCFQTTSTIYLNKNVSHDSQFNKMRQIESHKHINKKIRNIRYFFKTLGLICGLYKCEIVPNSRYYLLCGAMSYIG